jgi:hypothetical protein
MDSNRVETMIEMAIAMIEIGTNTGMGSARIPS